MVVAAEETEVDTARQRIVLLVEDEVLVRSPLAEVLRSVGYLVIEAANGSEAVEVLKSGNAVDLVFSDIQMPGPIDGLQLSRWIFEHHPAIPVLLTSGNPLPVRRDALPAGTLFVSKPYRPDAVVRRIRGMLAAARP